MLDQGSACIFPFNNAQRSVAESGPRGKPRGLVFSERCEMRTIVYVDGFNLYYRALKRWNTRWLDLEAFFRASLPDGHDLLEVKYFTAEVDAFLDADAPARQRIYLAAIRHHCRAVRTIKGRFDTYPISAHLVRPEGKRYQKFFTKKRRPLLALNAEILARDEFRHASPELGQKVHVWRPEEKGSDVNLAVQVVHDAWSGAADSFVICSVDSDLCGALRIVRDSLSKDVGLLIPEGSNSSSLLQCATWQKFLTADTASKSQLPDSIEGVNLTKPEGW